MEVYMQRQTGRIPIVIDDFLSLRWRRKYYDTGEFELHIPNSSSYLFESTQETAYVWFKGSVERGLTENVMVSRDKIVVSGKFESGYMNKRIVPKFIAKGAAPLLMGQAFTQTMTGTSVQNRSTVSETADIQRRWSTLLELETGIARAYNIGFYLRGRTLYIYDGIDRTAKQCVNQPIVFSGDDLTQPTWTLNEGNYRDCAYVAGQGEGDERIYVVVGPIGSNELYVDARDLTQQEQTLAEYQAQLTQRGLEKLAEYQKSDSFEASVLSGVQYQYGTDYMLGDIVTVQMDEWRQTHDFRITEMEQIWEGGRYEIFPTFGDPMPEKLNLGGA